MNILFFGSSSFAAPILETLIKSKHNVSGVISTPDKKSGRGQKLAPTPIKELAIRRNVPCWTPARLDEKSVIDEIRNTHANIFVVAAYGLILPKTVLDLPKQIALNVHPSRLPKYRGAAPIARQLLNGEKESGVSFIKMEERVDAGDIIFQETVTIDDSDDAESLSVKLSGLAAKRIEPIIDKIADGDFKLTGQDEKLASYAPKINKDDGLVDWSDTAAAIRNKIRAFVVWPGAYTFFRKERVKLVKSSGWKAGDTKTQNGEILNIRKDGIIEVGTGKGILYLDEIQPSGKKQMSAYDFCLGRSVKKREHFET